jgi:fatty-acid peroxygenase
MEINYGIKYENMFEEEWQLSSRQWDKKNQIILFDEASKILFTTACKWAGVPLDKSKARQKSQDMSAMIDAFGATGPRHWKGRCARNRIECWANSLLNDVRSGRITASKGTALYAIAWHKDHRNKLLHPKMAAIELINILRPITAIATYITFEALALHTYPQYREKLKQEPDYRTMFVQEVRRFYPFSPFLGAKVRNPITKFEHDFKKGDQVFLDIYGINHDKKSWKDPNMFRPEHFKGRDENSFDFIPQGGGDYKMGTRCPGEWITIELMKASLKLLVNIPQYEVPLQDFSYCLNRIPTIPKSRFIMTNIISGSNLSGLS